MDSKIETGFLKHWNKTRAFGVIRSTPDAHGIWHEFFVHVSSIVSGDPIIGSPVEFVIGARSCGRDLLPALSVRIVPKPEITPSLISTLIVAVKQ
jgi:cold shock CspA family protein